MKDATVEYLPDGTPKINGEVPKWSLGRMSRDAQGEVVAELLPENEAARIVAAGLVPGLLTTTVLSTDRIA